MYKRPPLPPAVVPLMEVAELKVTNLYDVPSNSMSPPSPLTALLLRVDALTITIEFPLLEGVYSISPPPAVTELPVTITELRVMSTVLVYPEPTEKSPPEETAVLPVKDVY
jgi:hypothetical protein